MNKWLIAGVFGLIINSTATAFADEFVSIGSGNWRLLESFDVMTDQGRGIAAVTGASGKSSVIVKCDSGGGDRQMYVSIISPKYLGEGRYRNREITLRFDQEQPFNINASHDSSTASIFGRNDVNKIVGKILKAEKLAFRATSYDYESVTEVFDIRDGKEAIQRAYSACGQALTIE